MSEKTQITSSRFKVSQNIAGQGFINGIAAVAIWDFKVFDALDEFDLATNTFTPKRAGYYLLQTQFAFNPNVNAYLFQLYIQTILGIQQEAIIEVVTTFTPHNKRCSTIVYLTPNDAIEILIAQLGEPILQSIGLEPNTFFTGHRLS
jgi:hypothetical protein